jgi:hypothetical protein
MHTTAAIAAAECSRVVQEMRGGSSCSYWERPGTLPGQLWLYVSPRQRPAQHPAVPGSTQHPAAASLSHSPLLYFAVCSQHFTAANDCITLSHTPSTSTRTTVLASGRTLLLYTCHPAAAAATATAATPSVSSLSTPAPALRQWRQHLFSTCARPGSTAKRQYNDMSRRLSKTTTQTACA